MCEVGGVHEGDGVPSGQRGQKRQKQSQPCWEIAYIKVVLQNKRIVLLKTVKNTKDRERPSNCLRLKERDEIYRLKATYS